MSSGITSSGSVRGGAARWLPRIYYANIGRREVVVHEFIAALRQLQRPLVMLAAAILVAADAGGGAGERRIPRPGSPPSAPTPGSSATATARTVPRPPEPPRMTAARSAPMPDRSRCRAGAPVIDRLTPAHRAERPTIPATSARRGARSAPGLRKRLRLPPEPALTLSGPAARRPKVHVRRLEISMVRKLRYRRRRRLRLPVGDASAHVTLERQEAPVGSSYKAVLRVPHGCGGSPTTAIRVRVPAGIIGVKPMPKPGWQLNAVDRQISQALHAARRAGDRRRDRDFLVGRQASRRALRRVRFHRRDRARSSAAARRSTSRWCRNARRACIAGSRSRPASIRERTRRGQRRAGGGVAPAAEEEVGVRVAAFLIALLTALVQASAAFAHASLVRAEPADGALVAEPPAALRLTFNEPVTPLVMRLIAPDGTATTPAATAENTTVTVKPPALAARHPCAELAGDLRRRASGRRLAGVLGRRGERAAGAGRDAGRRSGRARARSGRRRS